MKKIKKLGLVLLTLLTIVTFNADIAHATFDSKEITSFNFTGANASWNGWWWEDGVEGVITGTNIAVSLPFGISVNSLMPTIITTGSSISPASDVVQDFTHPVVYTVTAEDNSTQVYTVTVTNAPNPAREITSFAFSDITGVITGFNIAVIVPLGTDVTSLIPTIAITGASISPASGIAQDFTSPVIYTVTAEDSSLTRNYTVTVTFSEPSNLTALTALVAEAQNKYDSAVEGNLVGQYPAPLKANLQTAINTASILTDSSTQSVIDIAVDDLHNAVALFEAGVVVTAPITIVQNSGGGGGRGHIAYVPSQDNTPPILDTLPIVAITPIIQVPVIKNIAKTTIKMKSSKKIVEQVKKPNPPITSEFIPLKEENNLSASVASAPASSALMSFFSRLFRWFR